MCPDNIVSTDVLIVGSGAAGVTAAIEAKEAGANVIVIEKSDYMGGAAALSGGGCLIADTALQSELGISDSIDLAFNDWVAFGEGSADEVWARFYLENANEGLLQWTMDRGLKWDAVNHDEGSTVPRKHHAVGGGAGLWQTLHRAATDRGVTDWATGTAAKGFVLEDGRVTGIRAEHLKSGESINYMAKAVVMASGGFNANIEMIKEARPDLRDFRILEGSHFGNTGDGHRMVKELGGTLTHMENLWFYVFSIPSPRFEQGERGVAVGGIPSSIWVNMRGERFHNEEPRGGATGAPAVMALNPPMCWSVIDDSMVEGMSASGDPYYFPPGTSDKDPAKIGELLIESPDIKHTVTLEGLASLMGVPVQAFVETVKRYNSFIDRNLVEDPDHGKNLSGKRMLSKPPYHAFHFYPLARKNFGGVKTDLKCRVTDKNNEAIPGLYAAGGLAGMAGGHIIGKNGLEGAMLGASLFSGRVAGAWSAYEAGFGGGFVRFPFPD